MLILPAQIILLTNTSLLTQISSANPHQFCQPRSVFLTNTILLTQISSANPYQFSNFIFSTDKHCRIYLPSRLFGFAPSSSRLVKECNSTVDGNPSVAGFFLPSM